MDRWMTGTGKNQFVRFLITTLTFWVFGTSNLLSQGVLVPEDDSFRMPRVRPPFSPPSTPVQEAYHLRELSVDTAIQQQIATTQVTQTFENTSQRQIQASFVFPLPYDGAIQEMTLLVDGKEYPAKLLTAEEARKIYEAYVRRNQDPALLEWIGQGMFQTSVFPIPAGAKRVVTLKYTQLLRQDQGTTDYLFPLSTAKYTSRPLEKLSIRIAISGQQEIGNIYSPAYPIEIQRDDAFNVVISHASSQTVPGSDFRLFFDSIGEKLGVSLLSYWPAEEEAGYFILLATPQIQSDPTQIAQKTIIFVVDQSGSMVGEKIRQAREAAKFIVNNLQQDDLFNIIVYDSQVKTFSPELLRYNQASRSKALGFINSINAGGMTNIKDALESAMNMISSDEMPAYVVFMTDGLPTVGETNEMKIAVACQQANKHRARLINLGVGYDVNSRLLDRLARENNGQSEFIAPEEDLERVASRIFARISAPVLSNVEFNFEAKDWEESKGKPVQQLYPAALNDLFAGNQIVLVGRYQTSGDVTLKISGQTSVKEKCHLEFQTSLANKGSDDRQKFVAQLWAARRIGEIIDLMDLHGKNAELISELVSLSRKYGILTPYTSFLADDQGDLTELTQGDQLNRRAGRLIENLEVTGGQLGFSQRSSKQFLIQDQIASSEFKNRQLAERMGAVPQTDPSGLGVRGTGGRSGQAVGGRPEDTGEQNPAANFNGIRQVGQLTLYVRDKTLIAENALDLDLKNDRSRLKVVRRFSEEYFELVQQNSAEQNLILAQQKDDEELIVTLRGVSYLIQ
jgi:Ca-activated chloride channel family protein